jgi:hypothetical protein
MYRQFVRQAAAFTGAGLLSGLIAMGAAAGASAQTPTITFVGETAGDDVSLLLGDADLVFGLGELRPVVGLQSYVVMDEATDSRTSWTVTPSVGLRYALPTGFFQGKVGYAWVSDDASAPFFGGGESGITTSLHGEHWGNGRFGLQGIATHNWGAEYLWTRARGTMGVMPSPSGNINVGLEGGWQGHTRTADVQNPTYSATMVGPLVQWATANVTGTLVAGWKQPSGTAVQGDSSTWYARVELSFTPR